MSTASSRSKADQDPRTRMPPSPGYGCRYATHWVADKTRYRLAADPADPAALTRWGRSGRAE
ncbi:hypothetical protein [Streptomyces sp. NPDC001492]